MRFTYKNTNYHWSPEKFAVNLFVGTLIFAIGLICFTNSTNATTNAHKIMVTVESGDNLWSIAEKYADQSDPREIIDMIQRVNRIGDSQLKIGQELNLIFDSI